MMTMVISGSDGVTFPDSTNQFSGGAFSFKNRIINGDMRIDQRNAGASATITSTAQYTLDRWRPTSQSTTSVMSCQQVTDAPAGFVNSLKMTSLASTTPGASETYAIAQFIEGHNVADFGWGTANAKTVTLSFWVRSSVTGTYSGAVSNSAQNRSYPFTYSISVADTWEYKTVTITGDTTGTWFTNTSLGIRLWLSLGNGTDFEGTAGAWAAANYRAVTGEVNWVATNGATFYITGVQLEVGSVATPFERRPYGTELALCQRYFEVAATSGNYASIVCSCYNTTDAYAQIQFKVQKRATASVTVSAHTNWAFYSNGAQKTTTSMNSQNPTDTAYQLKIVASSLTGGDAGHLDFNPAPSASNSGGWSASAEL